ICVVCFLIIAPALVLYSMGNRFDFSKMKITATGGIYVRTFPSADRITIDSKIIEKPKMFSNSIFVQSLLPDNHTVLIEKNGFYEYTKTLPVKEKEVTKIENVVLFKKTTQFEVIPNDIQSPFNFNDKYIIKNNNLYYANSPENSELTDIQKATILLKKITAYSIQNNNILWLATDGLLYKSNIGDLSLPATVLTTTALKITKTGLYKILTYNQEIFIVANDKLLYLDPKTNNFEEFYSSAKDAKFSPDGKNIIYNDDNNIYLSAIPNLLNERNTLYNSSEKISNCQWINNYYIIFTAGNKIIISEIDYRNNINIVTLPETIILSPTKNIEVKNPKIYFNQQSGKLYILTGENLLLSEKILP
ncbi:MAG: hypothetical protein WCK10_03565, partial [Candidatus Staskawiczbacteria bacterium]